MKMQGDSIISALIGLVGAVSNNGKTEQTDSVIREAFLRLKDADSEEEMVQKIPCGEIHHCAGLCHLPQSLRQYFRLRYGAILCSRCEGHLCEAGSDRNCL